MKMTQFAKFANRATNQILGVTGLQQENLQSMFSYPNAIDTLYPVTVLGDIIEVDNAADVDAKKIIVSIIAKQNGSGNPSPSNIRNIDGWLKAIITHQGNDTTNTYTINFPTGDNLVYGGTLNITSGILTITHVILTIDGDTTPFTNKGSIATRDEYYRNVPDGYLFGGGNARYIRKRQCIEAGMLCSVAPFGDPDNLETYTATAYMGAGGTRMQLRLNIAQSEGLDTLEKINNLAKQLYAAGTPIQYVYPLQEVNTFSFTPTNIKMFEGYNKIYADCGSMQLEYYRREGSGAPNE